METHPIFITVKDETTIALAKTGDKLVTTRDDDEIVDATEEDTMVLAFFEDTLGLVPRDEGKYFAE